jgi:PhoD related phosphatase
MPTTMRMPPLLGLEGNDAYSVCILTNPGAEKLKLRLQINEDPKDFQRVAAISVGVFWRADFKVTIPLEDKGQTLSYSILQADNTPLPYNWTSSGAPSETVTFEKFEFYVPGSKEEPRIAFVSCNGFSEAKLARDTPDPYAMWAQLMKEHGQQPYSLLLFGGDQLYCDSIFEEKTKIPELHEWIHGDVKRMKATPLAPDGDISKRIHHYYLELYVERWQRHKDQALALATIPSVMMWDDHDIFDGYGSHPTEIQNCEVVKTLYDAARAAFELFQHRAADPKTLIVKTKKGPLSRAFAFRGFYLVTLDNRTERTHNQIMSEAHWQAFKQCLTKVPKKSTLLVVVPIPPIYLTFRATERLLRFAPGRQELEDDLADHWSAPAHQGERSRLLKNLEQVYDRGRQIMILSGDVHVGGAGVARKKDGTVFAHQIIASGIVHPPPSGLLVAGLRLISSDGHESVEDLKVEMVRPTGHGGVLIAARNFVTICRKDESKSVPFQLRATWTVEGDRRATYFAY